ncbi:hypothetical protein POJ06DRAFT_236944 [Lipomyces tetrasporus]|uniref:Uncharacterized protein n=1 Tax=Lipomyces tetrasporus TaxID=54092 RepID=A0AAD7QVK9_9ASCO|nr:uncharacterized protein POJ06DRAFT_236944 [Lipomyces tetrasporus]KAJ8102329.1 hypothetical protein POJ06DRAFT_236944 [Lipomyces tetrasporus]
MHSRARRSSRVRTLAPAAVLVAAILFFISRSAPFQSLYFHGSRFSDTIGTLRDSDLSTLLYWDTDVSGLRQHIKSSPPHCRDPYREPGYLHVPKDVSKTQWVVFDDQFLDRPPPSTADYPTNKEPTFSDAAPPADILAHAPHNWLLDLRRYEPIVERARRTSESADILDLSADQQDLIRRVNWIHNRRLLVLGDSIDRFLIQFFCEDLHGKYQNTQNQKYGGQHTTFSCQIPYLNFTIYHWHVASMYPTRPQWWWLPHVKYVAFEDRFENLFKPVWHDAVGMNGHTPDLVLFESGLWDERALRESYRNMNEPDEDKLDPETRKKKAAERKETGLGREGRQLVWEELEFFRARMNKFIIYLREKFGQSTPMMYRSLTTRRDSNKADLPTINMDRVSRALMDRHGVEVFEWARLASGFSNQYQDYLHIGHGPLSVTWANMALYYLFRAAGGVDHNGTFLRFPDPVGQYVKDGKTILNAPTINIPEHPDTTVDKFWTECHEYNIHLGGR